MTIKTISMIAAATLALGFSAVPARAQQSDVFSLNYFDHQYADGADGTVRVTNPGEQGAPSLADPSAGDLCAMIYVFRPDQQLAECCGCPVTPNGLLTLSVGHDLTSNPLTGDPFPQGVIKILSSTGTTETSGQHSSLRCNAATPSPTPSLLAWGTHVQSAGAVTETPFEKATLGADELTSITDRCGDILDNGSGHGVCNCRSEASH